MEGPILSPDGSQTWTGTKWVPIESETQHTSEFRNPFQSQHSVAEIGNHAPPLIEEAYPNEEKFEYIDIFNQGPRGGKWGYYWKILLVLSSIAAICLLAYYPSVEAVLCILLTLGIIWALLYGFQAILDEYLSKERPLHTKITLVLLFVGAIGVFAFVSLSDWGDLLTGILLTGAYIVPALLIYHLVISFDEKVETLGWKRGMISSSLTLLKWSFLIGMAVAVGLATAM
jgi:hypothetical protein